MVKPIYSFAQIADYLVTGYWRDMGRPAYHPETNVISFSVSGISPQSQVLARAALQTWQDVANLSFVESAEPFLTFREDERSASAHHNSVSVSAADFGALFGSYIGSKTFTTYIHEIGHVLGLGHPGPYNGSNAGYSKDTNDPGSNLFLNDTQAYSVMSYNPQMFYDDSHWRSNSTPMVADILAAEMLYGRAEATRSTDTVYGFNSNAGAVFDFSLQPLTYVQDTVANGFSNNKGPPALTILDRGGTDTLDCSGYSADQTISLSPGTFSSIGGLIKNIAIDLTTVLENAIGGGGNDTISGNHINNGLRGGRGNDTLDGGPGLDTALFSGIAAEYSVSRGGSVAVVTDKITGRDGSDTTNTERLRFADKVVAFDESAGQAYRLYQAALDRTPDPAGLSYWVNSLDHGTDLASIAASFIVSAEFKAAYGDPATLTPSAFLDVLYANILGRAPDPAGKAYWVDQIDRGFGRDLVLASFSESAENVAIVGSKIANGIELDLAWVT